MMHAAVKVSLSFSHLLVSDEASNSRGGIHRCQSDSLWYDHPLLDSLSARHSIIHRRT